MGIGIGLLDGEEPGLQVLADSAYGSGEVRAALKDGEHTVVIKPIPLKRNYRLGDDQFTRDDFTIDYRAETVTCPNGATVAINAGRPACFCIKCRGCPIQERCTSATGGRTVRVGDYDQILAQARARWQAQDDLDDYRQYRPMVERSISWIVTNGHRRVRYRGIERNRAQLALRIAAINLRWLVNLGLNHNGHTWAVT